MALYSPADALPNALENVGTALSLLLPLVVACRFRAAARLTIGRLQINGFKFKNILTNTNTHCIKNFISKLI